jgi:hypothetical protein
MDDKFWILFGLSHGNKNLFKKLIFCILKSKSQPFDASSMINVEFNITKFDDHHHRLPMSWNFNKICAKIIKQYVYPKFMGFRR